MPLFLRTSGERLTGDSYDHWIAAAGAAGNIDPARRLSDAAARLEQAFMVIRPIWWSLCRDLGEDPGAGFAVAATGSPGSDLGLCLAWSHLAAELAVAPGRTMMICDDPWLFRHIAALPGVRAGRPPSLIRERAWLALRGLCARIKVTLAVACASIRLRGSRSTYPHGTPVLLVYGHPASNAHGFDAYFGDLMHRLSGVTRLLHVDCPADRAVELAQDGRTASLHAWGSLWQAAWLPLLLWRLHPRHSRGPYGWLLKRAAARENSGGSVAMIAWQAFCQERWLAAVRPTHIAWPWENLAWERALCRAARRQGTRTVGYQHTVVGPHQINYSAASNWDGTASLPDLILSDGAAYRNELEAWGIPPARLRVAGALRFSLELSDCYDPKGPVLIALSSLAHASRALVDVAVRLAVAGIPVLVKEHPMYPVTIQTRPNLAPTTKAISAQSGLRAVVFATGTSGLDALRARVPAFRLLLEDGLAWDVAPAEIPIPTATAEEVLSAVETTSKPPLYNWPHVFAPVDESVWREALTASSGSSAVKAA